jgi:hypothetical protein
MNSMIPMAEISDSKRDPFVLGPMPTRTRMKTVDEREVRSRLATIFNLALDVERWPQLLAHYRFVHMRERASDGGGLVEMSANRPFGPMDWPTWWLSEMSVHRRGTKSTDGPRIRFRHIQGITTGNGGRVELPSRKGRDPCTRRACVERTAVAVGWWNGG